MARNHIAFLNKYFTYILTYFQSMAQFEKEKQTSLAHGVQPEVTGFESTSGGTWIYPTNYPVRQYQVSNFKVFGVTTSS